MTELILEPGESLRPTLDNASHPVGYWPSIGYKPHNNKTTTGGTQTRNRPPEIAVIDMID